jgi:RNA polymerase sigma-70 factor, ECF subfamily
MSEDAEREIQLLQQAGDINAATTTAVRVYGDEVFSYLVSRIRDEDVAADVFSRALEDLLKSLPAFEWRCSMRTWFYRLAHNASVHYHRLPAHRLDRRVEISQASELVAHVRSRTNLHQRSEIKDRIRELREELDADEQQLLTLRIESNLAWSEIALILEGADDSSKIERAAARLRQQFQKIKTKLRDRAIAEGLFPAE